jgi:hypothetical protein
MAKAAAACASLPTAWVAATKNWMETGRCRRTQPLAYSVTACGVETGER